MNNSVNTPLNSLAPAATITSSGASSNTADNDFDSYVDPNSLDLDTISPEELDAVFQKASNNPASSLPADTAMCQPLAISGPSTSALQSSAEPGPPSQSSNTTSTPQPISKPDTSQTSASISAAQPSTEPEASQSEASQSSATISTAKPSADPEASQPNTTTSTPTQRSPRSLRLEREIIRARQEPQPALRMPSTRYVYFELST